MVLFVETSRLKSETAEQKHDVLLLCRFNQPLTFAGR